MKRNGTSHTHNAAIPTPDASSNTPDGSSSTPDGSSSTLDGSSSTLDASAKTPNASTSAPDASANTLNGRMPQGFASSMTDPAPSTPSHTSSNRSRMTKYRANASMAQRLVAAGVAIESVLSDSALQERMAAYGYDRTRMLEGQTLRQQALILYQQQRSRTGDQLSATDARNAARKQAHSVYMRHIAAARVLLRDQRGASQKLDLGRRKIAQASWLIQAQQFYANALADEAIVARLAQFNFTREQLLEGQALVDAVEAEAIVQNQRRGATENSTQMRDAAFAALHSWMRDFQAMARIALADEPQKLEQL